MIPPWLDPLLVPVLLTLSGCAAAYALWQPPALAPWKTPGEASGGMRMPTAFLRCCSASLGWAVGILALPHLGVLAAPLGTSLAALGLTLPELTQLLTRARRRARMEAEALPLVSSLTSIAGLPGSNAYDALYAAVAEGDGELPARLRMALRSVGLGGDLEAELRSQLLTEAGPSLQRLLAVLGEHLRQGTPLFELLHELEAELLEERRLQLKEIAARADLRLTVVGLSLLVPALYLVSVVPALLHAFGQLP